MLLREEADAILEALRWRERDPEFKAYTPETYAKLAALIERETEPVLDVEAEAQAWREKVRQLIVDHLADGTLRAQSSIFEAVAALERELRRLFSDVGWNAYQRARRELREQIAKVL